MNIEKAKMLIEKAGLQDNSLPRHFKKRNMGFIAIAGLYEKNVQYTDYYTEEEIQALNILIDYYYKKHEMLSRGK
tara:strand:- start:5241 stop:5465 length:225 start_codon:yes stop_codon:yes gene_type:complete